MDIEQEGGISEAPITTGGGDGTMDIGDKAWAGMAALLVSLLTTALGYLYKTRKSSQSLEDTTNEVTIESLLSLRARNTQLEERIQKMMEESTENFRRMLRAEESASQASIQASIANEAAARAKASADDVASMLADARSRLANLVQWMRNNGIEPPPGY